MKNLEILFEDDDILAFNKPTGLLSIPDRYDHDANNLKKMVQDLDANYLIVHRLDRDTSGVILIAKHAKGHKHLQHQFEQHTIQKEYLAIAQGIPQATAGLIEQPIVAHEFTKGRMIVHKKGKASTTKWKLEEAYKFHSLIRLMPTTGRTHQIRVHLHFLGFPIVADPIYGNGKPLFLSSFKRKFNKRIDAVERPLISRTALHAEHISFTDMNSEMIKVSCPLPKDLRASLNQLRKNC